MHCTAHSVSRATPFHLHLQIAHTVVVPCVMSCHAAPLCPSQLCVMAIIELATSRCGVPRHGVQNWNLRCIRGSFSLAHHVTWHHSSHHCRCLPSLLRCMCSLNKLSLEHHVFVSTRQCSADGGDVCGSFTKGCACSTCLPLSAVH